MIDIELINKQKLVDLNLKNIKSLCKFIVLNELHDCKHIPANFFLKGITLTITFLDEDSIVALNEATFEKSYSTDVISFSYFNDDSDFFNDITLGEIYVFPGIAKRRLKSFNTKLNDEVMLYIIHGILHVFNYKDSTKVQIKKMRSREKFYMDIFSKQYTIL